MSPRGVAAVGRAAAAADVDLLDVARPRNCCSAVGCNGAASGLPRLQGLQQEGSSSSSMRRRRERMAAWGERIVSWITLL